MKLAGPMLDGAGRRSTCDQLTGKVVVVYYWASWNGQAAGDFAKLKAHRRGEQGRGGAGGVNLDATADEAKAFLAKNPAPGTHLYQPGGLESKLATQYGVMVLPSDVRGGQGRQVRQQVGAGGQRWRTR